MENPKFCDNFCKVNAQNWSPFSFPFRQKCHQEWPVEAEDIFMNNFYQKKKKKIICFYPVVFSLFRYCLQIIVAI